MEVDHAVLPDNHELSKTRLKSVMRRLDRNPTSSKNGHRGFGLKTFLSSSSEMNELITEAETAAGGLSSTTDLSYSRATLGTCSPPPREDEIKILGVKWSRTTDQLTFDLSHVAAQVASTPVTKLERSASLC